MANTREPLTGQIFSNGRAQVDILSDARGPYPPHDINPININASQAALATMTGIQNYHSMLFEITAATGETLEITALSDGGVELSPIWVKHKDNATPDTIVEASGLGVGIYEFAGIMNVAGLKWTKSAGTNVMTIRGQMSGAS